MISQRVLAMQRIFGAIIALCSLITVPPLLIAQVLDEASKVAFLAGLRIADSLRGRPAWWVGRSGQLHRAA